jgi:hypothetical protein
LYPPEDGDVVDGQPALAHHLLEVSVAKRVAAIPADAEEDDIGRIVTPFEGEDERFMKNLLWLVRRT